MPLAASSAVAPALDEQAQEDFRVAGGIDRHVARKRAEIIELAIIDERMRADPERLVRAVIEIDDRQPSVREANGAARPIAVSGEREDRCSGSVGSPMHKGAGCSRQTLGIDASLARDGNHKPTHQAAELPLRRRVAALLRPERRCSSRFA